MAVTGMAFAFVGCAGIEVANGPQAEWRMGREKECKGDIQGALAAYRSAGARGNKMALYDAGRLQLKTSRTGDWESCRRALRMLCDCANTESAGFYYVQSDSEAARAAALAELAHAFEQGLVVKEDPLLAGYLYQEAIAVRMANDQWFSDHSHDVAYATVFESTRSAEKGFSRMSSLGYAGEPYRWAEIAERINPTKASPKTGSGEQKGFDIVSMSYDPENGDATLFEYSIPSDKEFTLATDEAIRREMFAKVKQEYCGRHPGADPADVRVSATHYQKTGNRLTYAVAAFWLRPTELEYSSQTRTGVLRLRFEGRDIRDAEAWAREHLEELANAQNIVLTTGQTPPQGARYRYKSIQSIDDGARLEIWFQTIE